MTINRRKFFKNTLAASAGIARVMYLLNLKVANLRKQQYQKVLQH
jgi:hypothetical protein